MSLRLRLALAFFLLSALPLAGFSVFSYLTSRAALRGAAAAEARLAARDLEQRVAAVSSEVAQSLQALEHVPLETWVRRSPEGEAVVAPALADLTESFPFLQNLEFVALPPPAPPKPAASAPAPRPPGAAPEATPSTKILALGFNREELAQQLEKIQLEVRAAAQLVGHDRGKEQAAADWERLKRRVEKLRQTAAVQQAAPEAAHAGSHPAAAGRPAVAVDVSDDGRVVGQLRAQIEERSLFRSVLEKVEHAPDEIPFAICPDGSIETPSSADLPRLTSIPAMRQLRASRGGASPAALESGNGDWVVVTREDPNTGYRVGIARPLSSAIESLRAATARNFMLGAGLVALAMVGFFPLSSRIVRDIGTLERGAARLAAGDLGTRVTVRGGDEVARLGVAFNRMAEQLSRHQEQLLEEARLRKEEEIARRLVAAENERRGRELDEARQFQLSLLPRELPDRPGLAIAVSTTPATEVGGDYYDFLECADGSLLFAVGDATGHGAAAGTMVTAVKGLFAGGAERCAPAEFLGEANAAIHRMGLVRRAMALNVSRLDGRRLRVSAAGMPPVLHFRGRDATVHEIELAGVPLGARAASSYEEATVELGAGDVLLYLSDGLPELPNSQGEPFGYERLSRRFAELASNDAGAIVGGLEDTVRGWSGGGAPADDVTFLVLQIRGA